ncbi:MAG: hypothetical protein ACFFD4_08985 [Candidatus Odinarchaeota archaeon]
MGARNITLNECGWLTVLFIVIKELVNQDPVLQVAVAICGTSNVTGELLR